MKKSFLFVSVLLLFVSCNKLPTSNNINKPVDSPAKSVQSTPAQSKQIIKTDKKHNAGSIKQDSGAVQKAKEAK